MAGADLADVVGDVRTLCDETYANAFNALVRFDNECSGVLLGNWCVGKRVHTFEMHARGISAFVDCNSVAHVYSDNSEEGLTLSATEVAGSEENRVYYGFEAQSRHFIDCVKSGTEPCSSMADAVKTMELVDAIYGTSM
jgi:predicted dehydrogenase